VESPVQPTDFGPRAARYDELRPADSTWWAVFDVLMREGDFRGRRVLEVGCGTGMLAAELSERVAARVWAVDPEPAMVELAQTRLPTVRKGRAEALPFKDGWFERVVLRQVIQHVDRAEALPELARVLEPGGRLVVATFARSHFERWWLNAYFPSIGAIDLERFPDPRLLCGELLAVGFRSARVVPLTLVREIDRETALERIRGRWISTFDLLGDAEFDDGLARAERELPATVETTLEWAIVVADA
jgi:ubiquinone/menaquinone biosynthesis C-methylase UbiE